MSKQTEEDGSYRGYAQSLLLRTGYRATWLPSRRIELGAVGLLLTDGRFDQRTDLRRLGVQFRRKPGTNRESIEYQSSRGVSTSFKMEGDESELFQSVGKLSAGVRFDFTRAGAVVFSAPECVIREIDDKRSLERRLRQVQAWDINWVVITSVVMAKQATVLVSGDAGAFVELRAGVGISPGGVELADVAAGFRKAKTSSMSVQLVSEGNLTPLYEVHRMSQPSMTRDPGKRRLVLV